MPTLFLLDNSLSMCQYPATKTSDDHLHGTHEENLTKREISHVIVQRLIRHISTLDKYEAFAVVAFSSTAQIVSDFTRDYEQIFASLKSLQIGDCACLDVGLNAVSDLVIEEWSCFTNVQILLITDCTDNLHTNSIKNIIYKLQENRSILKDFYAYNGADFDEKIHTNSILNAEDLLKSSYYANLSKKNYFQIKFPFSFANRFDIVCLNQDPLSDQAGQVVFGFADESFRLKNFVKKSEKKSVYLNELILLNNSAGKLLTTEKMLSSQYIENEFVTKIIDELYSPTIFQLKFGHMESNVTLLPAPNKFIG